MSTVLWKVQARFQNSVVCSSQVHSGICAGYGANLCLWMWDWDWLSVAGVLRKSFDIKQQPYPPPSIPSICVLKHNAGSPNLSTAGSHYHCCFRLFHYTGPAYRTSVPMRGPAGSLGPPGPACMVPLGLTAPFSFLRLGLTQLSKQNS